jgi:hypothetical protein
LTFGVEIPFAIVCRQNPKYWYRPGILHLRPNTRGFQQFSDDECSILLFACEQGRLKQNSVTELA